MEDISPTRNLNPKFYLGKSQIPLNILKIEKLMRYMYIYLYTNTCIHKYEKK